MRTLLETNSFFKIFFNWFIFHKEAKLDCEEIMLKNT